jgi:isocitrate dehydrogenase
LAAELAEKEQAIISELNAVQGKACDIGGYYAPSPELASKAMRPSATFNATLARLG